MLSAQKQQMSEEPPSDHSSPPASGFGKVLTSLQGLQQRLDDFSVEDVSHAHSQAVELIQQLTELEARLQRLHRLYRVFGTATMAIETTARIDLAVFDTDTDGLEKHPHLRAIVRAGKLIEMRPHLLHARTTTKPDHTQSVETEKAATHPLITVREKLQSTAARPDEIFHQGRVRTEKRSAADAIVRRGASHNALPVSDESECAERKLDDTFLQVGTSEKNTRASGSDKSVGLGAFDERLLKDLIDTYGEFAVSDNDTAATRPFPAASERKEDPLAELSRTEPPKKEVSTALMIAPEPRFLKPNAAPEVPALISEQEPVASLSNQSAPKAKFRGEIDQQLKSIIKDYGEVDLYSHGKSVNTKVRMITATAAALLALVLAGLLFFKTPPFSSSAPTKASTAEPLIPSAASVNDAAPQEKKKGDYHEK